MRRWELAVSRGAAFVGGPENRARKGGCMFLSAVPPCDGYKRQDFSAYCCSNKCTCIISSSLLPGDDIIFVAKATKRNTAV